MKVLLLGGTGAMGKHLAHILTKNGAEVFVTSRRNKQSKGNLRYIYGNAQELFFLQDILSVQKWDVIVDFMVYSTKSFEERVKFLLNNTKQYVFLSSARVYADSNTPITETSLRLLDISEDEEYLRSDEYALAKARQENILINSGKKNWTIIRPYITYSEIRLQLGILEKESWLYRALHGRSIVFSSDVIKKKTTLTYGFDVANSLSKILGCPKALEQAFHITTDESIPWSEVLSIYLSILEKHMGYKPRVKLLELDQFQNCKNAKYQICYDRLYDRTFNNSKIKEFVDSDLFLKAKDGLKLSLESFLKKPQFDSINWIEEAIKDRYTKEYTPLKEIPGIKLKIKYCLVRFGIYGNKKYKR